MYKPVDYGDYTRRPRFYYENIGGVYLVLLDILEEFEDDKTNAVNILNKASYWSDVIRLSPDKDNPRYWISDYLDPLTLCVFVCITADDSKLAKSLIKQLEKDKVYYPRFKKLIEKTVSKRNGTFYKNQNQELADRIQTLCGIVDDQKRTIAHLHGLIDHLLSDQSNEPHEVDIDKDIRVNDRKLGNSLTLDNILKWAKECGQYSKTKNVFEMLKNFMHQVDMDPEDSLKVSELENKLLKKDVDQPHTTIVATNCNVVQGSILNSQMPISPQNENKLINLSMQSQKENNDGRQQEECSRA